MNHFSLNYCQKKSLFLLFIILLITGSFALAQKKVTEKTIFTENLKFSIGGSIFAGAGFEKHDLFKTSKDDDASISSGGGFGVDLVLGFLITPKFEIDLNAAFQNSALSQNLKNADANFSRLFVNTSFKFLIPTKKSNRVWKVGGGIGYYMPQYLRIEWEDLTNIADGDLELKYKAAIGYHATGEYEMMFGKKNWSLLINITYYYTSYKFSSASSSNVTIIDLEAGEFEKLNGSSVNFGVAMKKYF